MTQTNKTKGKTIKGHWQQWKENKPSLDNRLSLRSNNEKGVYQHQKNLIVVFNL